MKRLTQRALLMVTSFILAALIIGGLAWALMKPTTATNHNGRPLATTMTQVAIFNRLGLNLVGVPTSDQPLPARYANLPRVGNHISVNFEQIINAKPSVVYVNREVQDDYAPQLKQHHIKMTTLDFDTYTQLQAGIRQLGATYHKTTAAKQLLADIELPKLQIHKPVKVLILMGMPGGTFLVANQHSYLGDLVTRMGGTVVAGDPTSIYTPANPQAIAQANPDVVIRLAHAMPASVKRDFDATFAQVPYRQLAAVQHHQVYDVSAPMFGISANLQVVSAYRQLYHWLEVAQ